ncbi:hypothetical protein CI15_32935 [Paraburkholderia monticola]|jgi:hypothetical protein|uniref:Uncharacterized protein n=1 Tax=Paraburkholderia monticola TaxID=1399968 RepID=A0A149PBG3_9BURK|nr:hypothetical protein [Paraburkholderia monticola]KXU82353.1 hypothetical protein CI15_32935 [Paraburkholderia monticola]
MATGTERHLGAAAMTVRRLRATPSTRLLKTTVGFGITLSGLSILVTEVSATIAPLLHSVAGVIMKAIV